MNVHFILFVLLSGVVPTEVVLPARDNLLPGHIKLRQSAPPIRASDVYPMKDRRIIKWENEHIIDTNTLKRYRRKRAFTLPKAKSTAGLEKDTDDPDGVYRTLDELKSMKPGPGVQWRDEMPVMSKDNAGDLRRKKRSRKIRMKQAVTNLKPAYKSTLTYPRELSPLNDVRKQTERQDNVKRMIRPVNTTTASADVKKSSETNLKSFNGRLKHRGNMGALFQRTLLRRLKNRASRFNKGGITLSSHLSAEIQARPGTNVVIKNKLRDIRSYNAVKEKRKTRHRIVRDTESSDHMYDSTDVSHSVDSDQWWGKKLDYIDSRKPLKSKLQNNTSTENVDSTSDQRHSAISLRGVISEQTTSKQSQQSENSGEIGSYRKQQGKGDDWLKNELMLIEIESRALKRKATQLHNKLRKANRNWRHGGSDDNFMYTGDGPRQDVVETYSRLNKRVENDGMQQLGKIQNIQATEHRIERKHRLPAYGGRLRGDIADAVIKLDNDLSDLKAKIMSRSGRVRSRPGDYFRRPGNYHDVFSDTGDHGDYYNYHGTGRYRRHVAGSHLRHRDKLHMFLINTVDPSSNHKVKFNHWHNHKCTHGSPCDKLAHKNVVTALKKQKHKTGSKYMYRNILNRGYKKHIERASNSPLPILKQMSTLHLHRNNSLNMGNHPETMQSSIVRIIISLAKLLNYISTLPQVCSHKFSLLTAYGVSRQVEHKILSIPGNSEKFITGMDRLNINFTNTQVNLRVLITYSCSPSDDNISLIALKTTQSVVLILVHTWTESIKLTRGRMRKYKQTQNGSPDTIHRQKINPISPESKKLSKETSFNSDHTHMPKNMNLKTSTKIHQKNIVQLFLYLKRLVRSLPRKQIKLSRLRVPIRGIRLNHIKLPVYTFVVILCDHVAPGLTSKHTRKADITLHHRSHSERLGFFWVPATDLQNEYILGKPELRRPSSNRNRLVKRNKEKGKAKEGLAMILQTKPGVFQRTKQFSGQWENEYVNLRLGLHSRLLGPNLKNKGLKLKGGSHDTFASPLKFTDSGLTSDVVFKNNIRNKRNSYLVIADPENENEISMKEELDNIFKKFPVSYSEKLLNTKLEQAEEAEMASTDVGRFIMERNKDTEIVQDETSETRIRRQVHASGDHTEHKKQLDEHRRWLLDAILHRSTKTVNSPESKQDQREKGHAWQSLPDVQLLETNSHKLQRGNLNEAKNSNGLEETDKTGKSMKRTTYTSNVLKNRSSIISKLMNLVETSVYGIVSRFTRDSPKLVAVENTSIVPVSTSVPTTSGETIISPTDTSTTDMTDRSITDMTYRSTTYITDFSNTDMTDRSTTAMMDRSTTDMTDRSTTDMTDRSTTDMTDRSTTDMTDRSTTDMTDISTTGMTDTSTSDMAHFATPFTVNIRHRKDINIMERSLEAKAVPGTGLGVELDKVDNAVNGTSWPSLHNLSSHSDEGGINETEQNQQLLSSLMLNSSLGDFTDVDNITNRTSLESLHNTSSQSVVGEAHETGHIQLPSSLMLNSSYSNVTNVTGHGNITQANSALKELMSKSNPKNPEFNKALKTLMTNSSYRSKTVANNKTANTSRKTDQSQKTLTDYFDNNANVEEASDQDVPEKATDLQNVDDKVQTDKPETSEGIQVDVKGHKVEPKEPFAFIEKDETKKTAEYQYTWGQWSECSTTCGVGQKFRTNRCGGDQPCMGDKASSETEVCSLKDEC